MKLLVFGQLVAVIVVLKLRAGGLTEGLFDSLSEVLAGRTGMAFHFDLYALGGIAGNNDTNGCLHGLENLSALVVVDAVGADFAIRINLGQIGSQPAPDFAPVSCARLGIVIKILRAILHVEVLGKA